MKQVILALSPHTDDVELAMGGTLARHLEQGDEMHVIALSTGNIQGGAVDSEFQAAMDTLGVAPKNRELFRCPARAFFGHRQEILDFLINTRQEIAPDLVYVPSRTDCHQDHETLTKEAVRAFRTGTVLGYELPWNHVSAFAPARFMKLKEHHLVRKMEVLRHYESQSHRAYAQETLVWALARVRGLQAGTEFAEAFEVIREVQ